MICPICKAEIIIDEWNGWRWSCCNCNYVGGIATDKEIQDQEEEMIEIEKRIKANET